jgi:hypothetical protein
VARPTGPSPSTCKKKVPAELHLYEKGPHGVGLGVGRGAVSAWPEQLAGWLKTRGLLTPEKTRGCSRASVRKRIDTMPLSGACPLARPQRFGLSLRIGILAAGIRSPYHGPAHTRRTADAPALALTPPST